jgi:hypothetical protein
MGQRGVTGEQGTVGVSRGLRVNSHDIVPPLHDQREFRFVTLDSPRSMGMSPEESAYVRVGM